MILIVGGSGSGKSFLAEKIICERISGKKIYLATMSCFDDESKKRILRHREKRRGKGFVTLEKGLQISSIEGDKNAGLLIECLGNLVANEMYDDRSKLKYLSDEEIIDGVTASVCAVSKKFKEVVIVSNDVFRDIKSDKETERYKKILGGITKKIVKESSLVLESVFGIGVVVNNSPLS